MALDPRYVTTVGLEQYFVDKDTGAPLAGGYINFWEDDSHTTPKTVYQLTGSPPDYTYTALPNPVQLSAVGTVQDANGNNVNIYYFPWDSMEDNAKLQLYYIEVYSYANYHAGGTPEFTRQGFPNFFGTGGVTGDNSGLTNSITNSQFVEVSFNPDAPLVINFNSGSDQVFDIAPGWELVISSSATSTVTLTRTPVAGISQIMTNPPYTLDFSVGANVTSLKMRQRLYHNPDIWSSTINPDQKGYVAGQVITSSLDGSAHTIAMYYSPSTSAGDQLIFSGSTGITGYTQLANTIELNPGDNTQTSDDGYVDILFVLPTSGTFNLTSVQVVGLDNNTQQIFYEQEPVNRQQDHLFHYYEDSIIESAKETMLTGWNFALNPYQEYGAGLRTVVPVCSYIADQTILYQQSASSVRVGQSGPNSKNGLYIQPLLPSNRFALIQFVDPKTYSPYVLSTLSSLVKILIFSSSQQNVRIKMRLIESSTLPSTLSPTYPISSWPAGSDPVFAAGWAVTQPLNDPAYNITTNSSIENFLGDYPHYSFDSFLSTFIPTTSTQTLGVVFYTMDDYIPGVFPDGFVINSISLVPNEFAVSAAPQTADQVLKECRFYYENSMDVPSLPAAACLASSLTSVQNAILLGTALNLYALNFSVSYQTKRATPTFHLLNPVNGILDTIYAQLNSNNALVASGNFSTASWTQTNNGKSAVQMVPNTITPLLSGTTTANFVPSGFINYQFIADARLGL